MWLEKLAPKKFLGKFPLQTGAIFVGVIILSISILCVISIAVEISYYQQCKDCTALILHNAYSFSINALIYCIFMVCINLWFIWGVKNEKSSVVLSWVVITALWWAQSFLLIFILLCLYITNTSIGWMVALGCAIIAFMIFGYFILVSYGYWLEIRKTSQRPVA